jgi:tRNA A-37 threonylcarbamoyl transferase component Bud32
MEDVPAGCVRVAAGRRSAVALDAHAGDARAMLAVGSLYEAASRDRAARPLQGRGIAYSIALPVTGTRAVVRHNRHGGLFAPMTRDLFLPPTRAPYELLAAMRLAELGVPTPPVLMYGVESIGVAFRRADVVTREIENARDLSEYMSGAASEAERDAAWEATRDMLAAMHAVGVRHHDLNVKNVLLAPTGARLTAHLLDVDRVEFGRAGDIRLYAANVERLRRSARKWRDERGATYDERELAPLVAA